MFRPQPLNADDLEKVIRFTREMARSGTEAQTRDATIVLLGTLGLRLQEALNLDVGDVGMEPILSVATLKGGKPRQLPLDRLLHRRLLDAAKGRDASSVLLSTRSGGRVHPRNLRRRWAAWCKDAIGRHIRFHDLRHSFAHYVYSHERDIFAVQRLLGHRKIETTHLYLKSIEQMRAWMPGADTDGDGDETQL